MISKLQNNSASQNAQEILEQKDLKYLDLLQYLPDDHILKSLSLSIASAAQLPPSSVFITGLAIVSSLLCRVYATQYPDGEAIPLGIYAVIEQPSGTGKSRCVKEFSKPVEKAQARARKKLIKEIEEIKNEEELSKDDKKKLKELENFLKRTDFFVTNSTPEALEEYLKVSGGFFALVSSEQGLFNSMLGKSYRADGGSGNNNDLLLSAFLGEYINSLRVSRDGFKGKAVGALCLFAQEGSIQTLLTSSGNTGMTERFIFSAEPHNIGSRKFRGIPSIDKKLAAHFDAILQKEAEKVFSSKEKDVGDLPRVLISPHGEELIINYKEFLEPLLKDGGDLAIHPLIRGAGVKANILIIKIAAILHIMYQGTNKAAMLQTTIQDGFVTVAINIVNTMIFNLKDLLQAKEIAGRSAEAESVMRIFEKDNQPKTERQIILSRSKASPFSEKAGNKSQMIRNTIQDLVMAGILKDISLHSNDNTTARKYILVN